MFGSAALGLASTIIMLVVLFVIVGGNRASNIIFDHLTIFIIGFGALWFYFVNKRLE